jgi:hypothetical protein
MSQEVFEIGSWKLNKTIFLDLADSCRKYYANSIKYGSKDFGYSNFCSDQYSVTKEFYRYVTEFQYLNEPNKSPVIEEVSSELTPAYDVVKKPTEFESLFYTPKPVTPEPKIEEAQPIKRPHKFNEERFAAAIDLFKNRKEKVKRQNIPVDVREKDTFKKLLPVNWGIMTTAERIEFSMDVKSKEFLKYIYSIEPSIENFIKNVKKETGNEESPFYVSIFKFPPNNYPDNYKKLIRDLVDKLNLYGRANLQYVECLHPPVIEIREVR